MALGFGARSTESTEHMALRGGGSAHDPWVGARGTEVVSDAHGPGANG